MGFAVAFAGALLLATIGAAGLVEPTETRYAEIAREMRASGDWMVPRLDGLAHFHKPPLAYWATAAGMAVKGENEAGARLPVALVSTFTLACVGLAARRRFAEFAPRPEVPVWIGASMALFAVLGRALACDPFLGAAVAAFWAFAPSTLALAALGAGFLAKGPVVFVPTVLVVLAAAAWERRRAALALLGPARGWLACAAIALPWWMLMAARVPGLTRYLMVRQVWERYTTTLDQRGGPPWYFVAVLLAGALPWTPLLVAGMVRAWRDRTRIEAKLLLCAVAVPLVFFSFSGSKLPAYLLPCMPAMALLATAGTASRDARRATAVTLAGLALALAGAIALPLLRAHDGSTPAITWPLLGAAVLTIAGAAACVPRGRIAAAGALVAVGWAALAFALGASDARTGSPRTLVRAISARRRGGEPVVEIARFNAGLPFYLREEVALVEIPRETEFDPPATVARRMLTRDALGALASRHARVWVLGPEGRIGALADSLGSGGRRSPGNVTRRRVSCRAEASRAFRMAVAALSVYSPRAPLPTTWTVVSRMDPQGALMRRSRLLPALLLLLATPPPATAAGLVTGIEGMTSTVMQKNQSSFSGIGVRVRMQPQRLVKEIELLPSVEYWRTSSTVSPWDIHSARKDATLAIDARWRFNPSGWQPYLGAGFGVHFISSEVSAPSLGNASDSVIKGGFSALAGTSFPLAGRVENFLEVKYHHIPVYSQFKINWGLSLKL